MTTFVDTHAHLYKEFYEDINKTINDSKNLGITHIISDGDYYESNLEMLDLANNTDNVYITLGYHPEYADEFKDNQLDLIINNINNPKVIAIGEIGLDYHYENYDKNKQITILEKQLKLAEEYDMPVVIHSREATQDTLDTLKKYKVKGVIHAFSGSLEIAKEYIKLGYKIGIGGVVTYKNSKIKEVIKEIGIENIILETDAPFLTPVPLRGEKNIPGYVKYIADFLSEYLNIPIEDISKTTNKNVTEIFPKFKF